MFDRSPAMLINRHVVDRPMQRRQPDYFDRRPERQENKQAVAPSTRYHHTLSAGPHYCLFLSDGLQLLRLLLLLLGAPRISCRAS